jgi:hypothetical protein
VEGAHERVIVAVEELQDLNSGDDERSYRAARRILGRRTDLGLGYFERAQAENPSAPSRAHVVRAAQLATEGIPA